MRNLSLSLSRVCVCVCDLCRLIVDLEADGEGAGCLRGVLPGVGPIAIVLESAGHGLTVRVEHRRLPRVGEWSERHGSGIFYESKCWIWPSPSSLGLPRYDFFSCCVCYPKVVAANRNLVAVLVTRGDGERQRPPD